jgi:Rieske Fe-S protein
VGLVGAVGAVAGCSTAPVPYDSEENGIPQGSQPTPQPSGGTFLASASSIPVGGGMAFDNAGVVVTQPEKGTFKAFSAFCTHMGCKCNVVADGTIDCPCHGSKFKITNGAPVTGPATTPLPTREIAVTDGSVNLLN